MTASPHPSPEVLLHRLLARGRLRQLQLLVALADCGSVQRAAQSMAMSQPAATQALADLEALVGEALFERHARGVRPTAFGQVLLPMARSVVQSLRSATEDVAALQAGAQALLRLGCIPAGASGVLAAALPAWLRAHDGVQLDLVEDHSRHLLAELAADRLDALVCRAPPQMPGDWQFRALRDDQPALVAAALHPLAGQAQVPWAAACAYPWLLPHRGMALREHLAALWSDAVPCSPPVHALCTTSLPVIAALLQDGYSLALSPRSVVGPWLASGQLVRLDVALPDPVARTARQLPPLGLLHPQRSSKQALLDDLYQHLLQALDLTPTA